MKCAWKTCASGVVRICLDCGRVERAYRTPDGTRRYVWRQVDAYTKAPRTAGCRLMAKDRRRAMVASA